MGILEDKCALFPVTKVEEIEGFSCGDRDLDEFFTQDCFAYSKELWFLDPYNKTGCRFIVVDAYNTPGTLNFYKHNGFNEVFSTEKQEKDYRHLKSDVSLSTRLLYYDLMNTVKEYM